MARTLLEVLRDWRVKQVDFFNPIGVKVGGIILLNTVDLSGYNFVVQSINEYTANGLKFVDYLLIARPLIEDPITVKLRVNPNDEHLDILVLRSDTAEPYNKGLHNVLRENTGMFEIGEGGETQTFYRIGEVKTEFKATIRYLKDENGDGKIEASEVKTTKVDLWDFIREVNHDGVTENEFLFVEMVTLDGWFEIWRGFAVDASSVSVL